MRKLFPLKNSTVKYSQPSRMWDKNNESTYKLAQTHGINHSVDLSELYWDTLENIQPEPKALNETI